MVDALTRNARKARLRLVGIAVVSAAVLAGTGVLIVSVAGGGHHDSASAKPSSPPSPSPTYSGREWTPGTAQPLNLPKPSGTKNGISVGFTREGAGAIAAAVYQLEDLDFLDDSTARTQLETITSPESPDWIDKQISQIRTTREDAQLPPSGGAPAGLNVSTTVDAVWARSLADDGSVVQVDMVYDRYATLPKGPDQDPLKDQRAEVIEKWEDGDWKVTDEAKYTAMRVTPIFYDPNSTKSWQHGFGWTRVEHE